MSGCFAVLAQWEWSASDFEMLIHLQSLIEGEALSFCSWLASLLMVNKHHLSTCVAFVVRLYYCNGRSLLLYDSSIFIIIMKRICGDGQGDRSVEAYAFIRPSAFIVFLT